MQRPPCSFFAVEGSGELSAAAAAEDGDCLMEPMRQQQQETFEVDDEDGLDEVSQDQQQDGGDATQAASQRRPPVDLPGAGQQASAAEGQHVQPVQQETQQQQQQEQEQVEVPMHRPEHSSEQRAPGSAQRDPQQDAAGGDGVATPSNKISSSFSVAVGLLVAVVAVLSLGFAVALLQPATRDRIRSAFGGSRCACI